MTGLSGVEGLSTLKILNLANTAIVTDSLLCCRNCPSLVALNVANAINVNGDQALRYLSGQSRHCYNKQLTLCYRHCGVARLNYVYQTNLPLVSAGN